MPDSSARNSRICDALGSSRANFSPFCGTSALWDFWWYLPKVPSLRRMMCLWLYLFSDVERHFGRAGSSVYQLGTQFVRWLCRQHRVWTIVSRRGRYKGKLRNLHRLWQTLRWQIPVSRMTLFHKALVVVVKYDFFFFCQKKEHTKGGKSAGEMYWIWPSHTMATRSRSFIRQ